jgi:hypothetical protein
VHRLASQSGTGEQGGSRRAGSLQSTSSSSADTGAPRAGRPCRMMLKRPLRIIAQPVAVLEATLSPESSLLWASPSRDGSSPAGTRDKRARRNSTQLEQPALPDSASTTPHAPPDHEPAARNTAGHLPRLDKTLQRNRPSSPRSLTDEAWLSPQSPRSRPRRSSTRKTSRGDSGDYNASWVTFSV